MATTESRTSTEKPKRRWFQFRLWMLFVLITVCAVVFACLPWWRVHREIWALRHGDEPQRQEAAEALALMGPKARAAVPALIDALEYEDTYEQAYFQFFYDSYAGPTIEPDLISSPPVDALVAIGSPAVPDLIAAMQHHEDEDVRRGCGAALGRIQPTSQEVIERLKEALADRHWGVREQAAYSLSKVMKESASLVPLVRDLLHDDHEYVRFAAANLVGNVGPIDGETLSAFSHALTDENEHVRETAARLLKDSAPEIAIHRTESDRCRSLV